MLYSIIKNFFINITQRFLFNMYMCCSYFLIALSIIWGSIANYYYFTQQDHKFIGALVTGVILFILGLIGKLLNLYLNRKAAKQNKLNNIMPNIITSFSPIIIKSFINKIVNKKSTKVAAISMIVLAAAYYLMVKHKHLFSQTSKLIK